MQKTAYEMRISDWSSDVCSSDLLVAGKVLPTSRDAYRAIIARLVEDGAQAVILGCTEIMLLVRPEDSQVPIFDTTAIHAAAAIARKSAVQGKSVSVRVYLGVAGIIKKTLVIK